MIKRGREKRPLGEKREETSAEGGGRSYPKKGEVSALQRRLSRAISGKGECPLKIVPQVGRRIAEGERGDAKFHRSKKKLFVFRQKKGGLSQPALLLKRGTRAPEKETCPSRLGDDPSQKKRRPEGIGSTTPKRSVRGRGKGKDLRPKTELLVGEKIGRKKVTDKKRVRHEKGGGSENCRLSTKESPGL